MQEYNVYINGKFVAVVFDEDSAWSAISLHMGVVDVFEVRDGKGQVRTEFCVAY